MPIELEVPIETADVNARAVVIMVFESRVVDDVDNRTYNGGWVTSDSI